MNDIEDIATIDPAADHVGADRHLRARGWVPCGEGDWAIALRSPSGKTAARISPFDPTAPFTAELYRVGRGTGWFPELFLERSLDGGASLLAMEFLYPVSGEIGVAIHRRLRGRDPGVAAAAKLIEEVHGSAMRSLPWCGPIDDNPSNVMAAADGSLRITDPYYAAGPELYATLLRAPLEVARAIPAQERRHMLAIPLASSGGWQPEQRRRMHAGLARADETLSASMGPSES